MRCKQGERTLWRKHVHDDIKHHTDAALMARFDEELCIHWVADVIVRCEEEPRSITPVQGLRRILNRQKLDTIHAHAGKIVQVLENNLIKRPEFNQRSIFTGI